MPDERILSAMRTIGGIVGLLEGHADLVDEGKPMSASTLRDLAERLREEHQQLWDLLFHPERENFPP